MRLDEPSSIRTTNTPTQRLHRTEHVMHPNAELIQAGFDAFASADLETIDRLLADDIVWHSAGTSVLAGEFEGKEAVLGLFGRVLEVTGGTFRQDVHAILADDEHVVALVTVRWDQPVAFTGEEVFVWHVRDGKGAECWAVPVDQAAAHAALPDGAPV
jgi:ketosteroid isomerase-like protein